MAPPGGGADSDSDVIEILSSDDDDGAPNLDGMFDLGGGSAKTKTLFHPLNVHSHLKW